MPSPLFLVESSAKAASLTDLLSQKIDTLIVENVPIEVKLPPKKKKGKDGRPFLFHAIPQEKEIIDNIVLCYDRDLYLAFDNDQQGEHWSWMIREFIADNVEGFKEPKRLNVNGITEEDIQNSLKSISENNYHEGLTYEIKTRFDHILRNHFKRLTGSEKAPVGLSPSFSAITFLFFLSEREDEIQRFSPLNKGQIVVKLTNEEGEFEARLKKASDLSNDGLLKSKDEFERVKSLLKGKDYSVKSICRTPKKIHPPLPFNTVNLIQEAYLQLEMDPEKTLSLARELFHGAEIDGRNRGLISYFITENTDLPEDVSNVFREYLSRDQSDDAIGSCQITNKDGDLPIIPLMPYITPEHVIDSLDQEAVKLYELIRNRALASQMDDALIESIEAVIQAGDECIFVANKLSVIKDGYLALYHNEKEKDIIADSPITDLQDGQVLNRVKAFVEATSGIPPEYYTLESIFSDLDEMGVSVSSEMAVILKEMLQLDYLKIAPDGTLHPNENCSKLVKLAHRIFPTMSGLNLSAYFMQTVEEVTSGRKDLWEALSQFDQILHMHGKKVEKRKISTLKAEQIQAHQKASPTPDISQKQHSRIIEEESSAKPSIERDSTKENQINELETHESQSTEDSDLHKKHSPDHVGVSTEAEMVDLKRPESVDETVQSSPETSIESRLLSLTEETDIQMEEPLLEENALPAVEKTERETLTDTEMKKSEVKNEADEILEAPIETVLQKESVGKLEEDLTSATFPEVKGEVDYDPTEDDIHGVNEEKKLEKKEDGKEGEFAEKASIQKDREDKANEKYCPDCGRSMEQKEDAFGRYWQCTAFPQCRHAESYDRLPLKITCPICNKGEVITKRTPIGKRFYVCAEKECEFITWHLPHNIPCPECDNPFLVEKKNPKGETILKCPKAGCRYQKSLSGSSLSDPDVQTASLQNAPKVRKVIVKAKSGSGKPTKKVVRRVVRVKPQ